MKRAGVDCSRVATKPGPTGRSCILSCGGQVGGKGAGVSSNTHTRSCPALVQEEVLRGGKAAATVRTPPQLRACPITCPCANAAVTQRTMRTCLEGCPKLEPAELGQECFEGAQWAFLSACEGGGGGEVRRAALLESCCVRGLPAVPGMQR